jgi:hypothetical protein
MMKFGISVVLLSVAAIAFSRSCYGLVVVTGYKVVEDGSSESYLVQAGGTLQLTPSAVPYQGKVTLNNGYLLPAYDLIAESGQTVVMSGDLELNGPGQIGLSPYVTNPFDLTGDVSGVRSLVFGGGGPQRYFGDITVGGDLILGDRGQVEFFGLVAPAGDIVLSKGNQDGPASGGAIWQSPTKEFAGDLILRDRFITVVTDLQIDDLIIDPRRSNSRVARLDAGIVISPGATAEVRGNLAFRGGSISGHLVGVGDLYKETFSNSSLASLGDDYDGNVYVQEGLLRVADSGGLGSTVGATRVVGKDRALVVINQGVVVSDDVFLNDARGFNYGGALSGPGTLAGNLYLGVDGAYVGGENTDNSFFPGSYDGGLTIAGMIDGGRFSKVGTTDVSIVSGGHTYTGATEILNGALVLKDGGRLASTSEIVMREIFGRGTLRFDDRGVSSTDRVDDAIPIRVLGDNILQLLGNASQNSQETIGHVAIETGKLFIDVQPGGSANTATLRINGMNRQLGATAHLVFSNTRAHTELSGVQLDDGLVPWAVVGSRMDLPNDFVTIGPEGVTEYRKLHNYMNDINAATSHDNVQLTADTILTADRTINALALDYQGDSSIDLDLKGHTLNVDSGGILSTKAVLGITNGRLTSGSGELILHSFYSPQIAAAMTNGPNGPVAVTISGQSDVHLSGVNDYTGGTFLSGWSRTYIDGEQSLPDGGDVTISSATLYLRDAPSGAWHLGTLQVLGGLVDRANAQSTGAIRADEYRLEFGSFRVPIEGVGTVTKTGEGVFALESPNPNFMGQIIVEKGTLDVRRVGALGAGPMDESHATIIKSGGVLGLNDSLSNEMVILDGGDVTVAAGDKTWSGPLVVTASSRIMQQKSNYQISGPILGSADLQLIGTLGDFGQKLTINASLADYDGNLRVSGGNVLLAVSNPSYQGNITVDATNLYTTGLSALGTGVTTVTAAGRLTPNSNLTANLVLQGGTLGIGTSGITIGGQLRVEDEAVVDTSGPDGVDLSAAPRHALVQALTTFADGSKLKKFGRGNLTLANEMHLEGDVTIVGFDGVLQMTGKIFADRPSTRLNLFGSAVQLKSSVQVSGGATFQVTVDGAPTTLVLNAIGNVLSGGGTVDSDVVLGDRAVVAPGNSAGRLTIIGDLQFGRNDKYQWELTDIGGSSGDVAGWDLLQVQDSVIFGPAGQPLVIELAPSAALLDLDNYLHRTGEQSIEWKIVASNLLVDYSPTQVTIDTHLAFPVGGPEGEFSVRTNGGDLYLAYAVPEPAAIVTTVQILILCAVGLLNWKSTDRSRRSGLARHCAARNES